MSITLFAVPKECQAIFQIKKVSYPTDVVLPERSINTIFGGVIFENSLSDVALNQTFLNSIYSWDFTVNRYGEDSKGVLVNIDEVSYNVQAGKFIYLTPENIKQLLAEDKDDAVYAMPEMNKFMSNFKTILKKCVESHTAILVSSDFPSQEYE